MTDDIPETPIEPARRSLKDRVSVVWLVPLGALLIALGIAWHSYQQRGALIEITFHNASGISAGQTQLRYREVTVGTVEQVTFSEDLSNVVVHVRVDKDIESFVDTDASFWVVRPEVSTRGVTGLDTVLSGVYIEGSWDGVPGELARHHTGLETAPIATLDQDGRAIVLRSPTGKGLNEGTPILFKGLEVGRIGAPRLGPDGITVEAPAFIYAPHDALMSTQSRFWNTSGVSFSLGAGGASVDFASLASLITGGVSFETVVSGGAPVENGDTFTVYDNQDAARTSLFEGESQGMRVELSVVFEENVTGLAVGAPVTLRGLEIGEVAAISGKVDPDMFGDDRVRLIVVLSIRLDDLQLGDDTDTTDENAIMDFFEKAVAEGTRARLARGSILTGGLKIEIVEFRDAPPAVFQRDAKPFPILPSVPADLPPMSATAEGLLKRVNDLPVEELLKSAIDFMDNASRLVASDDIQRIPSDVSGLIDDVRGVVASEQVQALPEQLSTIVTEMQMVLADLRERDAIAALVEAVDEASQAADDVSLAVEGVPELIDDLRAIAAKAEAMDLETLMGRVTSLVASADALIDSDSTRALPASLSQALDELGATLSELRAGGTVENVNATLASTRDAADALATASADLPGLVNRTEAVLSEAEQALSTLSDAGALNRETQATMREVTRAAEAVRSLARMLERKPNALITGR
ncbi:intermembrane transport protein PqiB [Tropicimonas sp.]|uniref:PqiB family protein n=1 Tax=Tropicimonas sp. TaxID=2067044 RepID=UPI003A88EE35